MKHDEEYYYKEYHWKDPFWWSWAKNLRRLKRCEVKKSKRKKWIQFMNPMIDFRLYSEIVSNFRVMENFYDHVTLHQKLTIPCNPNESSYIQFLSSQWVESLEPYGLDNTLTWISKIFNLGKLFFCSSMHFILNCYKQNESRVFLVIVKLSLNI